MRRVVVTGLGAVTPVGNTIQEFWSGLKSGSCGIDLISRFDASEMKTKIAAEVKNFDPLLYFEKKELRHTDLFAQYAVAAADQAVADSGIKGKVAAERFGVYIGSGIGGITTLLENHLKLEEGKKVSPFMVPMMIMNMAAGLVSIRYEAKGPTLPIVTACATSTHSIGEAYRAIAHGYADAILAGGTEAAVCPLTIAGFSSCMALTTNEDPKTACVPFDRRRNGFVMGEGAAVLVLEEYEHARKRGAPIYAEICGYGNSSDAYHVTMPEPEADGITRAITQAMEEAGICADEQTYINAHGTSTQLNDKTETKAFKKAFGEIAYRVAISSTKSMTGHMLGAAGAVEAAASVLALKEGVIPPTIGLQEADPECDLDYTPGEARKADLHTAISTSLGFGGHNACLVFRKVEE